MDIMWKMVQTEEEIRQLASIADEVWHQHFSSILSSEQIDYMLDKFQSEHAMTKQMKEDGYEYYFIMADGVAVGYTGIKREKEMLFLSKLYVLKRYRGNGYASQTFHFLKEECKKSGLKGMYLTVNRYNDSTIAIYKKTGFKTVRTQVTDIGNGFVMDDYVMELMA